MTALGITLPFCSSQAMPSMERSASSCDQHWREQTAAAKGKAVNLGLTKVQWREPANTSWAAIGESASGVLESGMAALFRSHAERASERAHASPPRSAVWGSTCGGERRLSRKPNSMKNKKMHSRLAR